MTERKILGVGIRGAGQVSWQHLEAIKANPALIQGNYEILTETFLKNVVVLVWRDLECISDCRERGGVVRDGSIRDK